MERRIKTRMTSSKIYRSDIIANISLFEAIFDRFGHNPSYQHMYVKAD